MSLTWWVGIILISAGVVLAAFLWALLRVASEAERQMEAEERRVIDLRGWR